MRDVFFFSGIALMAAGLYFVYWPMSLVVPGAIFIIMGLAGGRTG